MQYKPYSIDGRFLRVVCVIMATFTLPVGAEFIAEGVTLTPLTRDGKSSAVSWAYRGDLIAVDREVSDTQSQLVIMKADGSNEVAASPIGHLVFVEWSWSGTKLAYEFTNAPETESQGGVFIYDVPAKRIRAVSPPYRLISLNEDDGPVWSADERYVAYEIREWAATTITPREFVSRGRSIRFERSRSVPGTCEAWVAEVDTGKTWRLLPHRGESREPSWNPSLPPRLTLRTHASDDRFDIATVDPDSKNMTLLTDVGIQSVRPRTPRWSPIGGWVAFTSDVDMRQAEREEGRTDCWISRPDGSEARNLTNATALENEYQLRLGDVYWSWDSRWILMDGDRFDNLDIDIATLYIVDPVNGGYWPAMTSYPRKERVFNDFHAWKWSYDSTKIAVLMERSVVRNWGPDPQFEQKHWVLSLYDVRKKEHEDILIFDEQVDGKVIMGATSHPHEVADISWSPDNRSILLTIATIVSKEVENFYQDVYRLDLPDRLIDPSAAQHIGPPIGKGVAR